MQTSLYIYITAKTAICLAALTALNCLTAKAADDAFLLTTKLDNSFIESVYNKDFTNRVAGHYHASLHEISLLKSESFVTRAVTREYYQKTNQVAEYTKNEFLNKRLPEMLLKNIDHDSRFFKVVRFIRSLLGSNSFSYLLKRRRPAALAVNTLPQEVDTSKMSQREKIRHYNSLMPVPSRDNGVETRIRAKWNLLQTRGNLRFQNNILDTRLDVDLQGENTNLLSMGSRDKYTLSVNKEIKSIDLNSSVNYELENKVLKFNLSKKITDNIRADISSVRLTNRDLASQAGGYKNESFRLSYQINF